MLLRTRLGFRRRKFYWAGVAGQGKMHIRTTMTIANLSTNVIGFAIGENVRTR